MGFTFTKSRSSVKYHLIIPILLFSIAGCEKDNKTKTPPPPAAPVTAAIAVKKDIPRELKAIGTVKPYETVSIKALVSGQLVSVNFKDGQNVKKGDVLFVIDKRQIEAAIHQAEANLARNTALYNRANDQAKRYAALMEQEAVSKEQFDQAQSNAQALLAQIKADEAAIENLGLQLEYCTIRAPFDGRLGESLAHGGALIKAYDTALVDINRISPTYVEFDLPEKHLKDIKAKMALGRLGVSAYADPAAKPEQGALAFIDNEVNTSTATIKLKAMFDNPGFRLWPGQFVNVTLTLGGIKDAVVVPSGAVQTGQSGQYVFVIKGGDTAETRPVVPGITHEGMTAIESGLNAGEMVVADGHLRVAPGGKLAVKNTDNSNKAENPDPAKSLK